MEAADPELQGVTDPAAEPDPEPDPETADDPVVSEAHATASQAAAAAGATVTDVHGHVRVGQVSQLLDRVWGRSPDAGPLVAVEVLTALAKAGGQVTLAEVDDHPVGATVGLLGREHATGRLFIHSHVTGVLPEFAGRGLGRALKWHQRAWSLARGIDEVRWTFDPLVRRNAVFNLLLLGAQPSGYQHDVYGRLDDERNRGLPTDRIVLSWQLRSPRARAAAAGRGAAPDLAGLRRAGAEVWVEVGDGGQPVVTPTQAPRRLVQVPPDIESLRSSAPDTAADWAQVIRDTLGASLDAGQRVSGITRDGWYVLAGGGGVAELADT